MKICPICSQTYGDDSLNYCLNDGTVLSRMTAGASTPPGTLIIDQAPATNPNQPVGTQTIGPLAQPQRKSRGWLWLLLIFGGLILICGGGLVGLRALISWQGDGYDFNYNYSTTVSNTTTKTDAKKALTMAQYEKLRNGMTYKQVVDILGSEGEELSRSEIGRNKTIVYMWKDDNFSSISAIFFNDKLMSKSKSGL